MSTASEVKITNGTGIFELVKDEASFQSYWVCVKGKCPGLLGLSNAGMIVPLMFRADLNEIAISSGFTAEDLSPPQRPEKIKASAGRIQKVIKKGSIRISMRDRMRARMKSVADSTEDN